MDYQNVDFYKLNHKNPDLVFNYATGTVTYRKEPDENGNIRIVEYRKDYDRKGTVSRIVPSYELTVEEFDVWKKKLEDEALDYWHTDHQQTRNNVSIENLLETDLVACESVEDEMIRKHDEQQRRMARLKAANELLEGLTETQRRRYIKAVAYKKTNRVIAAEEGCSHQMVSKSVSQAEARIQEAKDKRKSNA